MMVRRYSELVRIKDYYERFNYLKLESSIGELTFGYERYLNQELYRSTYWRNEVRPKIIARDDGNDLAHEDYPIAGNIIIHHINPITIEMIIAGDPRVYDPENLVCVSSITHNAIHYGSLESLPKPYVERQKGDTKLW